jgi:hypothetical protein
MSTRARLARDSAGISELEDLVPTALHLVKAGANGFRPLAAKAKGDQPTLAEACRKVGVVLPDRPEPPRRGKRAKVAAKLLPGR